MTDGTSTEETLLAKRRVFLAAAIDKAITCEARTAQQFFTHVTYRMVVDALKNDRERLTQILIAASAHPRIAPRMNGDHAANQIELAVTSEDPELLTYTELLKILPYDTLCENVDHHAIGAFLADVAGSSANDDKERDLVTLLIAFPLEQGLVTTQEILTGYGTDTIRQHIDSRVLLDSWEVFLTNRLANVPFDIEEFTHLVSTNDLVKHIPVSTSWLKVIQPKIFIPNGFSPSNEKIQVDSESVAPPPGSGDTVPKA